jgi:hypothetical protein
MNHKEKSLSKRAFIFSSGLLLLVLMACNLVPVNSQSEPSIAVETTTPSHPGELTPQSNPDIPLSEAVTEQLQAIFARGQLLGNQANVFAKVGDSITVSQNFLYGFGLGSYNLGEYSYLQSVVDFYGQAIARDSNSFANTSLAAAEGWAAWAVLDASMGDEIACPGVRPLNCEYNSLRPSVALIMFGTNDVGYRTEEDYYADLSAIVAISIEQGIIPVLSTIPNRPDQAERVIRFNEIVRQIANENAIPLMDFYSATITLPNSGLSFDNLHPSSPSAEIGAATALLPANLQFGYTQRNVLALEALHAVMLALGLR